MLTFISVSDSVCSICLPAFVGGYVRKCKGSLRRGNRTWQTWQTCWQTDVAETGHGACSALRSVCSFSFSHLEWHMFRIMNHAKLPLNMACSSASREHQSKKHLHCIQMSTSRQNRNMSSTPSCCLLMWMFIIGKGVERKTRAQWNLIWPSPEQQKCAVWDDT